MESLEAFKENIPPPSTTPASASSSAFPPHSKEISAEQKRRIDQNFRAAKAILSRKRPHLDTFTPPACKPLHSSLITNGNIDQRRAHSADSRLSKSCNTESYNKSWKERFESGLQRQSRLSDQGKCTAVQQSLAKKNVQKDSHPPENLQVHFSSLISDDVKLPEQRAAIDIIPYQTSNTSSCSGISCLHGISSSHASRIEESLIPDSDIDESILKQLDELCEAQLSANKCPSKDTSFVKFISPLSCVSSNDGNDGAKSVTEMEHMSMPDSSSVDRDFLKRIPCFNSTPDVAGQRNFAKATSAPLHTIKVIYENVVAKDLCVSHALLTPTAKTPSTGIMQMDSSSPVCNMTPLDARDQVVDNVDGDAKKSCVSHALSTPSASMLSIEMKTVIPMQVASPLCNMALLHGSPSISPSVVGGNSSQISECSLDLVPSYLRSLNDSQKEAVLSDTGKPLLILAGPGSGKTSTMVARLLRLLDEGVNATNILAMTFTTAAATEMRDRVGSHVGKLISKELNVCTFHSFCLQLCRSHAEKLGRTPMFLVYGHGQQRRAVVEATRLAMSEFQPSKQQDLTTSSAIPKAEDEKNGTTGGMFNPQLFKEKAKTWDKFVTQAKASGRTPEFYEKNGNLFGAAILKHYNATLAVCDALDYHDFINCAVSLLRNNSEVLEQCLSTWTTILVDEFQDTSTMQYELLCLLASHKRVTVVGDDDQSIFSFNGANSNNFEAFRKDFYDLKEVRLQHNYRSTRCIVEAAGSLIGNNLKRCENKQALTDNDFGEKITIKECRNEDTQCCFIIDTIMMKAQTDSNERPIYGNCAILYRRQVTGKVLQSALRSRKIPFNVHGVAFYRKKIVKTVLAMLWTALNKESEYCSRVYKSIYAGDKAEAKKVVEYVEKVAKASNCSFWESAQRIFTAKVSGTFSRNQLGAGKKVLTVIDALNKLARKEHSLSTLVTSVMNLIPQRSSLYKRAIVDADEGKFLNEDDDPRTVLEYLLDDVSDFLCNHFDSNVKCMNGVDQGNEGCLLQLKLFLEHLTSRELGNFKTRKEENKNSVTLTTIHQSKGLEWDTVFIIKTNDSEIPLLHETMGSVGEGAMSLEEERRLFYVAMTRAKKKLYILYVNWDKSQQLLRPSRFLRELPRQLLEFQVDGAAVPNHPPPIKCELPVNISTSSNPVECVKDAQDSLENQVDQTKKLDSSMVCSESRFPDFDLETSTDFLKGFNVEARSTIANIFHSWAKKPAFQDPKRLIDKVCFVLDERMRSKTSKNKDALRAIKCSLDCKDAILYAQHVLHWVKIPQEERTLMQSEKQEFFQQKCAEKAMGSAPATSKQLSYLKMLGCTTEPTSKLHASKLIEQYKKV